MRKTISILGAFVVALALAGSAAGQTTPPPSERGGALPGLPAIPSVASDWAPRAMFMTGTVRDIQGAVIVLDTGRAGPRPSEAPPAGGLTQGVTRLNTDASTRFYVSGVQNPTLADISAGDRIIALVERRAAGGQMSLWAKGVTVLPDPAHIFLTGEVADFGAAGFQLLRRGTSALDVQVTAATKVIVPGQAVGALANGDRVALRAIPVAAGGVRAEIVLVNPVNRDNAIGGVLAAVNGAALVVWTHRGDSVDVDAASTVFARPDESIATLRVGQPVQVIGIWNAARTAMTAQLIGEMGVGQAVNAPAAAAPTGPVPRQNRQP